MNEALVPLLMCFFFSAFFRFPLIINKILITTILLFKKKKKDNHISNTTTKIVDQTTELQSQQRMDALYLWEQSSNYKQVIIPGF